VFLNEDGSFTAFEVVPSLRITFAPETNPPDEVVILELRDLSDADRLRLMKCAAPMKISVDWIWGQFVLEPEQLLATITPCGGFIFMQGVFKADGFKKDGRWLSGSRPCEGSLHCDAGSFVAFANGENRQ
jgi:hypothetical protein